MTFAMFAEHNSRHSRHLSPFEQDLRGFTTVPIDSIDVGESIEGAGWPLAMQAKFIQTIQQQISSLAISTQMSLEYIRVGGKCGQAGPLCWRRNAIRGIESRLA